LTLVLQILLAVVVLVGLITVIMSVKNWHWAQMLLLLTIFFCSLGSLVLGLEVYRIHRNIRAPIPRLEQQLADVEAENEALRLGADATMASKIFPEVPFDVEAEGRMPGMNVWINRLQDVFRQRGRVWRGVASAGPVDPATGRVPVRIENPQPHGLSPNAIVYLFEEGEANAAAPSEGAQYLGEFRVVSVSPDGAVLESVPKLDNRTGNRLAGSQKSWVIYETMPADRHELFAGATEEQLRQWFPEATAEEYVKHGTKVDKPSDTEAFNPNIAIFNEQGHRLGPNGAADAFEWRYERQLRDYAYLFSAANDELVALAAEQMALLEDNKKLAAALEIAKKLGALRTEEKQALAGDLEHMQQDRQAIETQLATVERVLANVQRAVAELLAENADRAAQLKAQQQQQLDQLDRTAPPPNSLLLNATP
jgi:hypothetical protein